jgi:hypothetical protein
VPTRKPIYLDADGIFAQLADGEIINAGGTIQSTFTVGGRGLLFDDGTSTGGSGAITLQTVYDQTPTPARIKLATGKDFIIADDTDDGVYFKVDAETGKVTITGDLEVIGGTVQIDTIIQDSDHWTISPRLPFTTALKIEPDNGVVPVSDLIIVRNLFGAPPVLRLTADGHLLLSNDVSIDGDLIITGLIDDVDVSLLKTNFESHLTSEPGFRHAAVDVDIATIPAIPTAVTVQDALEETNDRLDNFLTGLNGYARGYEHAQTTPATVWTINHNFDTVRVVITIYDSAWFVVIPNSIQVVNTNTVEVTFHQAMAGSAMLVVF